MNYIHKVKSFGELNTNELYELLRLRSEVFVVEQNCIFMDQDNKASNATTCCCLAMVNWPPTAGWFRQVCPMQKYRSGGSFPPHYIAVKAWAGK